MSGSPSLNTPKPISSRIGAVASAAPTTWSVWVGTTNVGAGRSPGIGRGIPVALEIGSTGSWLAVRRRGSANTSSVPAPSLRTVTVAVTGAPAGSVAPLGTPVAVIAGASKEMRPRNAADRVELEHHELPAAGLRRERHRPQPVGPHEPVGRRVDAALRAQEVPVGVDEDAPHLGSGVVVEGERRRQRLAARRHVEGERLL